jgi:hypothetical protein
MYDVHKAQAQTPLLGSCVCAGILMLNYSATNMVPTQKDKNLLLPKERLQFQTYKQSSNQHK